MYIFLKSKSKQFNAPIERLVAKSKKLKDSYTAKEVVLKENNKTAHLYENIKLEEFIT